jgi:site-specific DNA-methyltransferase (adenine-specific)
LANPRIGKLHPTEKPVKLLEMLVETYSKENMLILDNTMGVGSTGVACVNLNRQFIGIEKEKCFYDLAVQRLQNII